MKALILSAGYATRLYPLTREYPKSLLTIKGKPIVNFIIDKLKAIPDINEIIIITNSKFIPKFRIWKKGIRLKAKRLSLVDDLTKDNESRRGAVGDMDFAVNKRHVRDDLLVIGGDNLFNYGLKEFISFAKVNKNPVIGVFDIRNKKSATSYGVVKMDKRHILTDFQEKPKEPKSSLVAMCLYYFPREKLGLIRQYLSESGKRGKTDATGWYIKWLIEKAPVSGFVFKGRWYDIGDYKFYNRAKQTFN